MKRSRDKMLSDIELFNAAKNDAVCFAAKEMALFMCIISFIFPMSPWLQWTCIIFGALLAIFAIIWDALISYRKVKAVKVKFLWWILSIQGIGITLLLLMKTSIASIVLLLLAIQIISLVATLIIGRKTDYDISFYGIVIIQISSFPLTPQKTCSGSSSRS